MNVCRVTQITDPPGERQGKLETHPDSFHYCLLFFFLSLTFQSRAGTDLRRQMMKEVFTRPLVTVRVPSRNPAKKEEEAAAAAVKDPNRTS